MIVNDVATKALDTESLPQQYIAGLISGIKFIVFFQSGEAFMVEGNKNTHTHIHTYTHTHTHTYTHKQQVCKKFTSN